MASNETTTAAHTQGAASLEQPMAAANTDPHSQQQRPSGLQRFGSMHYWLQERLQPGDEDLPQSLHLHTQTSAGVTAGPRLTHRASANQAYAAGSEADSDEDSGDWQPGSPDLRQGLLRHSQHSQRHPQHHDRAHGRQHSRLSGGRSGSSSGVLTGLFGRRHSRHASGAAAAARHEGALHPHAEPDSSTAAAAEAEAHEAAAAAAVAALLGPGNVTFGGARQHQQQPVSRGTSGIHFSDSEAAAAAAAAAQAAAAATAGHVPADTAITIDAPDDQHTGTTSAAAGAARALAGRSRSASAAGVAAALSGQLNEQVFNGDLTPEGQLPVEEGDEGGVSDNDMAGGLSSSRQGRRAFHSIALGELSSSRRRWQHAAQKVIAMQHITSSYRPGALQGLDVKRHCYDSWFSALHTDVNITIVDYNKDQVEVADNITNAMLPEVLKVARPEWSQVRWINVQGLSWDVISQLAVAFDLHPLSVEDIVHIPQRIKADFYQDYLYVSVILLTVEQPSHLASSQYEIPPAGSSSDKQQQQPWWRRTRSSAGGSAAATPAGVSPTASRRHWGSDTGEQQQQQGGAHGRVSVMQGGMGRALRTRLFGAPGVKTQQVQKAARDCPALLQPMQPVVEQASMFLFRDGTLITMFASVQNDSIPRRLLSKLEGFRSLLTDSQDASYLFNAVLDAVVDHTLPLVQIYSSRIAALESAVLLESRPRASLTKELHLLSNDLKLLRRTLVPTQHLVHKLQQTHDKDNNQGFLSPLTVLYLSDVYDHISTVVEDMFGLAEDAKDLIDLIFNTIAHTNNSTMQMLAVVSTIFLPITFLAGVYGTNFDRVFPEIHWEYGYVYFWGVCVFITLGFAGMLKRWGMFDSSSA